MANHLHEGDLPDGLFEGVSAVAVDSEAMGLRFGRDPLCVAQLSAGDGDAHVVRLNRETYDAPNLKRLLQDKNVLTLVTEGGSCTFNVELPPTTSDEIPRLGPFVCRRLKR